jgi:hypothetical protein
MEEGISITQALNKLQSWLNNKDYEKVLQGAQEILDMEPGNKRALALMKMAEQKRHEDETQNLQTQVKETVTPTPTPAPAETPQAPVTSPVTEVPAAQTATSQTPAETPSETPTPAPTPTTEVVAATPAPAPKKALEVTYSGPAPISPLIDINKKDKLKPEAKPEPVPETPPAPAESEGMSTTVPSSDGLTTDETPQREKDANQKKKHFFIMILTAILVVLIGGMLMWFVGSQQTQDTINEIIELPEQELTRVEQNEVRTENLSQIKSLILHYEAQNGTFPSPAQVSSVIENSGAFETIPEDPRQGEKDTNDEWFTTVYAHYEEDNAALFILSTLLEDNDGKGLTWIESSQEVDVEDYPDFRDLFSDHTSIIGTTFDIGTTPEPSDTEIDDEKILRPTHTESGELIEENNESSEEQPLPTE